MKPPEKPCSEPGIERTVERICVRPMIEDEVEDAVRAVKEIPLFERYGLSEDRLSKTLLQKVQSADTQLLAAWNRGAQSGSVNTDEENFAGFALFAPGGTFMMGGYLKLLVAAPKFQGCGVGDALLSAMEEEVKKESGEMFLLVSDFNIRAQRFYERNGYRKAGALPGLVLEDVSEFLYWKRLKTRSH